MTRRMVKMELAHEYCGYISPTYVPGEVECIECNKLKRKENPIVVARTNKDNKVELFEITGYYLIKEIMTMDDVYCSYDQLIKEMEVTQ